MLSGSRDWETIVFTISLREVCMNFDTFLGHTVTATAVIFAILITVLVMGVYWEG